MTALSQDAVADLAAENARLQAELRAARDHQNASAEILRSIAGAPGDAERSLYQIAESTMRLFGAPSATIHIAKGDGWSQVIRVGDSSKRVGAGVPESQLKIGGRNMPGTIVGENRQVHLPDLDNVDPDIADWPGLPHVRAAGTKSMSGSPLRREGKAIGALIVYRDRLWPFTDEELALQQNFADQAAIAIENARLFNETREALERQTATADILKVIAGSPSDVQPVFDAIAERSNRLVGGYATAVFSIVDDMLHLSAFTPTNPEADAALKARFPSPLSARTWGEQVRKGEIVVIADTEADGAVTSDLRESARMRGFRSMIQVPLLREQTPIGLISVTRAEAGTFPANHIQLLQTFADQAVIAIENVRLFNETKEALERQTATAEILKVIASSPTDVQPVFEAIATSANKLIGGFSTAVFRFVDEISHLAAFTPTNPAADEVLRASFPSPLTSFEHFRLAQSGQPVQIPDIETLQDSQLKQIGRARGFRSMLFTPLMNKGTAIGLISVTRLETGVFTAHHVQLLQTFADQAVIAIENVRLFDEVQARTEDLRESLQQQTATADVLKVISRSAFDLPTVLHALLASACRLCEADIGTIRYLEGDAFRLAATFGCEPEWIAHFSSYSTTPDRSSIFGRTIVEGHTVHVPDVLADPDFKRPNAQRLMGFRAAIGVPLVREGQTFGVVNLFRFAAGSFAEKQIELVQTFADQAAIAIQNVRLFDEVQAKTRDLTESLQQQTATAEVLKVISRSTFDLKAVLTTLVQSARDLCNAPQGMVLMRDGEVYRTAMQLGYPPEFEQYILANPIVPNPHSGAGRAAFTGQVAHFPDVLANSEYRLSEGQRLGGYRALLSIPLLREGEVVGVFSLGRTEPDPFTPRQIELVQTFADQAVIAIENVRLFDEVQARTKELAASLDDLRTAQDRLIQTEKLASLGQLTAGIAHEIKNPLNFVNNFAALSAELTDELNDLLRPLVFAGKAREEIDELTGLLKNNLEKVVQHGKRADSIVKNMLLHSREGSGEHRPADINALLDESLNLAYHGARAEKPAFNVTLQRNFDPSASMIELFPQEITRVFLNLISNGFYAVTRRKTELGETGFDPVLSATTKDLGDAVEIRIRDNGTGIPPEVRDKMFNPFFTTKPAGEGTGLGLSMSHDIIVKQHGGSIDVETEPGQFTEFRIILPRTSNSSRGN